MVKADERDRKVLGAAEKIGGLVSGDGEGSVDPQKVVEALSTSDVDLRSVATPETARRAGLVGRRFAAAVLDRAAERAHGAGGVGEPSTRQHAPGGAAASSTCGRPRSRRRRRCAP